MNTRASRGRCRAGNRLCMGEGASEEREEANRMV